MDETPASPTLVPRRTTPRVDAVKQAVYGASDAQRSELRRQVTAGVERSGWAAAVLALVARLGQADRAFIMTWIERWVGEDGGLRVPHDRGDGNRIYESAHRAPPPEATGNKPELR